MYSGPYEVEQTVINQFGTWDYRTEKEARDTNKIFDIDPSSTLTPLRYDNLNSIKRILTQGYPWNGVIESIYIGADIGGFFDCVQEVLGNNQPIFTADHEIATEICKLYVLTRTQIRPMWVGTMRDYEKIQSSPYAYFINYQLE